MSTTQLFFSLLGVFFAFGGFLKYYLDAKVEPINSRIDSLQQVMIAKFEKVDAHFEAAHQRLLRVEGVLDARLKHLEER